MLKAKYFNIKSQLRKQFAEQRKSTMLTGGGKGPTDWQPESEVLAKLVECISTSIVGTESPYDDDNDLSLLATDVELKIDEGTDFVEAANPTTSPVLPPEKADDYAEDWSSVNPSMLKSTPNSKLISKTKFVDRLDDLKKKMIYKEIELREKEFKRKEKMDEAEHELKVKLLQSQIEESQLKIKKLKTN